MRYVMPVLRASVGAGLLVHGPRPVTGLRDFVCFRSAHRGWSPLLRPVTQDSSES